MAKRINTRLHTSRSSKTKKRLAVKNARKAESRKITRK